MIPQHTYLWFDLGFTVILTIDKLEVNFEVYRQMGRTVSDSGSPLYECEVDLNSLTTHLDDAAIFCEGSVSFEGCINWQAGTQEQMAHLCNLQQLTNMGEMLRRLHQSAVAFITHPAG